MSGSATTARGATPPQRTQVAHLAILVVYFLKEQDLPLLELHLDRIERHTHVPYTLYAVANRVPDRARAVIEARPNVKMCRPPMTDLRASREHGYYLDAMVPIALADGASHLCTLDVDAFPIDDGWVDAFVDAAPPTSGITGVLRTENGDVALPHPSCIIAHRSFFERFAPSFTPDSDFTPEFRRFLRSTGQAADTGIRLGFALWQHGLAWGQMTRTNVRNPHYLIAGIYGDVVFHLGGASRKVSFRRDFEHSRTYRATRAAERIPLGHGPVRSLQLATTRWVRGEIEDLVVAYNQDTLAALTKYLVTEPEHFIAYLRGAPITGSFAEVPPTERGTGA